jgi:hypothetical protein
MVALPKSAYDTRPHQPRPAFASVELATATMARVAVAATAAIVFIMVSPLCEQDSRQMRPRPSCFALTPAKTDPAPRISPFTARLQRGGQVSQGSVD